MMPLKLRSEHIVYTDKNKVQLIANLVEEGSQDPFIRELTINILKAYGTREKDAMDEISAIFDWVKRNIKYVKDVICRDSYHTAARIVKMQVADCDDFTILLNSMLGSIGYQTGARIITVDPAKGFHHIYSIIRIPQGRWVALDASDKIHTVGTEPRWVKKRDFVFACA